MDMHQTSSKEMTSGTPSSFIISLIFPSFHTLEVLADPAVTAKLADTKVNLSLNPHTTVSCFDLFCILRVGE